MTTPKSKRTMQRKKKLAEQVWKEFDWNGQDRRFRKKNWRFVSEITSRYRNSFEAAMTIGTFTEPIQIKYSNKRFYPKRNVKSQIFVISKLSNDKHR